MADENAQNTQTKESGEKTYTQAEFDALTAKHQQELNDLDTRLRGEYKRKADKAKEEAEKAARQAGMTELEKANDQLADLQKKYQESQDTIALTSQKDETRKLMGEMGVEEKCLDFVFVPKDMEATKARTKAFKEYIDKVKKETFESNFQSKMPGAGSGSKTGSNMDINSAIRAAAGVN